MKSIKELYQNYKESYNKGYSLAKEIDELVILYGRENFLKKNVDDKDRERLEDITYKLGHMCCDKGVKPFFMLYGFQKYKNKNAWKRLKRKLEEE